MSLVTLAHQFQGDFGRHQSRRNASPTEGEANASRHSESEDTKPLSTYEVLFSGQFACILSFLPRRSLTRTVQQWSREQFNNGAAISRGSEHVDNLLDGFVGAVVGGFKLAAWTVFKVRLVLEAAVRDRSAEPFMEEQE